MENKVVRDKLILIIDDSEMERALLKKYLEDDFLVHECESAEDGLLYLEEHPGTVKLILVDYLMPNMSGMEFLNICQEHDEWKYIPKIMITSNDRPKDQIQAFRSGAYDFINKPPVPEVVRARIHHAMEVIGQLKNSVDEGKHYREEATLDKATGLLNKVSFEQEAEASLENAPIEQKALLVIDIDNFKTINDSYGHIQGDEVIKTVANVLIENFRRTDYLGRFGGDEFVVLINSLTNQTMAKRKAEDIIKAVNLQCTKSLHMAASLSIGIAYSEENEKFENLFSRADQALYQAKNTGKGKSVVFGEHVPEIEDNNKPLVLVCSSDYQLFISIALAYGQDAGFIHVSNYKKLEDSFLAYKDRIRVICIDMKDIEKEDSKQFEHYIKEQVGKRSIQLIAVGQEGNMTQLRNALDFGVNDILAWPLQVDIVQRKISKLILKETKID